MTTFDERERAAEAAFAHDQEMRFKALAHRNHELGLWAAAKMGKTGEEAEAYARTVVAQGVARAGEEAIETKVAADLAAANVDISHRELGKVMMRLLNDAVIQQKAKV